MTYRNVVVAFCLVAGAAGSARAGDKQGCKDPAWAPRRLPGFEIDDCSTKAWASIQVFFAAGEKRIEGELTTVSYTLRDDSKDPVAKKARDFYAQQAAKAGGTLATDPGDGFKAYLVHKTPKGEVYMMYDHGSGSDTSTGSYTLTTLRVAPAPQDVVARAVKAPLDTRPKVCADPPWLVKGMPGFKRESCDNRDLDTVTFKTKDGDTTIAGQVSEVHYTLTDEANNPVAALVAKNFANALKKVGADVVSSPDDTFTVVAKQKTKAGEVWYGYVHSSGSEDSTGSYALITLQIAPPKACTVEIYGVNFDTDKATLRPDSDPVLEQVLALFQADPKLSADLSGHTDDVGAKDYNQKLSAARAEAVKAWLVGHGVAAGRLTTHGYGDTRPLVPNTSDENRAKNRRVELQRGHCKS